MKLGIATLCPHIYYENQWYSFGPFVLEMNVWGELFDEMVFIAPIENGPPPSFWIPYKASDKIKVISYRVNKGKGLNQSRISLLELPAMVQALIRGFRSTDAFHVRSPGNIGLVAAFLAPLFQKRICAKYAGQWTSYPGEALSNKIQRAVLGSLWFRGPVLVYGNWPNQPPHIVPMFTSVMAESQLEQARRSAAEKKLHHPIRILYVGRITQPKHVDTLLIALSSLKQKNLPFECIIVGDGPNRGEFEELSQKLQITKEVQFTGGLVYEQVLEHYQWADILVLVSEAEGWPKAIAEGMAFGLICIGANRGLVPQMLGNGRGLVIESGNSDQLAGLIQDIVIHPEQYQSISARAAKWAQAYSIVKLREAVRELLSRHWMLPDAALRPAPEPAQVLQDSECQ